MPLKVDLVSPERILYSGEADMVVCRTVGEGEVAFMTGHAPFLGALDIGEVRMTLAGGGENLSAAVHRGFVEVREDLVSILSDAAELGHEIDVSRAERAHAAADEAAPAAEDDDTASADARRRAALRLEVAKKSGS